MAYGPFTIDLGADEEGSSASVPRPSLPFIKAQNLDHEYNYCDNCEEDLETIVIQRLRYTTNTLNVFLGIKFLISCIYKLRV